MKEREVDAVAKKKKALSDSISVQGTRDIKLPQELSDYYGGKGTPVKFLKEHYGFCRGMTVEPRQRHGKSKMIG